MSKMAKKTCQTSFDLPGDFRTDYVLMATGAAAALIALIYLFLI